MKNPILFMLVACLGLAAPAEARPLQILHTNDLHSHFERSMDAERGGYAALKAVMDRLRAEAAEQGIETLTLDAGDFSEGTHHYFAGKGDWSWRMMDALGYDAVVLGNHDYLMGTAELDALLERVRPGFRLLGANFAPAIHESRELPALNSSLRPFVELRKAGLRVAVLGLANDELEYRWRVGNLTVDDHKDALAKYLPGLRATNDVVIVLTHVGTDDDRRLARETPGVDLVVGGHWHEYMDKPYLETGPGGVTVPVVQAGDHGKVVGRLLVDVEPGKPLEVLDFSLVPVPARGPRDEAVERKVLEARVALEKEYGKEWLAEEVGRSEVPLARPTTRPTEWGALVADAQREAVGAELGVDSADLYGDDQDAGAVTRESILLFYPRMFSLENRTGWTVWTSLVYGWVLKFALEQSYRRGVKLVLSNVTFRVEGKPGKEKLRDLRVGGYPLRSMHSYRVAVSEGIGRAIDEMIPEVKAFFRMPRDSGIPIWTAIERKLRAIGGVVPPGYGGAHPPLPTATRRKGSPAGC